MDEGRSFWRGEELWSWLLPQFGAPSESRSSRRASALMTGVPSPHHVPALVHHLQPAATRFCFCSSVCYTRSYPVLAIACFDISSYIPLVENSSLTSPSVVCFTPRISTNQDYNQHHVSRCLSSTLYQHRVLATYSPQPQIIVSCFLTTYHSS